MLSVPCVSEGTASGADCSHSHVPAGVLDTKLLLEVGGERLGVLLVKLGVDVVQARLCMTLVRSEALW